jgi:uncharacterized protein (TIGR02145 family)
MATNKRDLKSFIRYDGNKRVIPGGNILARKKPKVGRWTELDAYECCNNPFTTTTTTTYVCNDIVLDGGFESWETNGRTHPTYWYGGERESSIKHSGLYSVHLYDDYPSTYQIVTPTTDCITLTFWYYNDDGGCSLFEIVRLGAVVEYLQADGSWDTSYYQWSLPDVGETWTEFTMSFTTIAGTSLVIDFASGQGCDVYYDDVSLCQDCSSEGCVILGYLYNWFVVDDARNIAPSGWHVPTRAEMITLATYLGGSFVAGGKLKETGTTYWLTPNTGATNSTGFNGRGTGYIASSDGTFDGIGEVMWMWTSTEYSGASAFVGGLGNVSAELVTGGAYNKNYGMPIRLIKDDSTNTGMMVGNDGKIYKTVKIGSQVWMAENLAETQYRNYALIPNVLDDEAWIALETGALCPYDDDYTKVGCGDVAPATTTTTTTAAPTTTTTTTTAAPTTTTTTTVEVPSDIRLKDDITPTGNMIGECREYTWKWNATARELGLDSYPTKGVIAQEVKEKYPKAVVFDSTIGYYRVNYEAIQ